MADRHADLIAEAREAHDRLNCLVTPHGQKTEAERNADIEAAMAACWKAADALEAEAARVDELLDVLDAVDRYLTPGEDETPQDIERWRGTARVLISGVLKDTTP